MSEESPTPRSFARGARRDAPQCPRILVVDDEPQALQVFSAFLTAAGMAPVPASSAERALELLASSRFDTILTDVRMPGLDGTSLLRAVRDRDADLPVILVTGCLTPGAASEALDLGAIDCLTKPVAGDLLVRTVSMSTRLCRTARFARRAARESTSDGLGGPAAFARAVTSLYVAWQPIVRASDSSAWGQEAFVRTLEPSLSTPQSLFAAAARMDATMELGRKVRRAAAIDLAGLAGPAFLNVDPRDLDDADLLEPSSPLSRLAASVVLELTDQSPIEEISGLRDRVRSLRGLGYRVGVDDVGSGGASLSRLARVEPEFAKLRPSVVRGLDEDPQKRRLAASMTHDLHDLGMQVVATGVETVGEHEAAVDAGVDFLQGFLFGQPAPRSAAGPGDSDSRAARAAGDPPASRLRIH